MLICDAHDCRQFAGADIVLRTGSGKVIQYFQLRSGFDKHAGAENTRVNLSPDGVEAERYGTVKLKNFLVDIDPEELWCKEIEDAIKSSDPSLDPKEVLQRLHASIRGDADKSKGGDLYRFVKLIVYSTGRYILRDEGDMSTREMSRNYFGGKLTLG
jgi:hypothetical protein